eukprot:11168723-Lingulodinium_polyedra.AAC.1
MRSATRSPVAAPRVSQSARSMRRPPRGGRRAECADCEMLAAAAVGRVSERVSTQFSRQKCFQQR